MYELGINMNLMEFLEHTSSQLELIDKKILISNQGSKFEAILCQAMNDTKNKFKVSNISKIEHISGQKFPDIIIHTNNGMFGVEVKTSKSMKWETLGGSIFESTKIKGVDVIAIFFANFSGSNPEYRFNYMEDCISDIAITHKPRYVIKMDLNQGESVFEKTQITYNQLSESNNPFALVRDYMKEKSGDLWWIDDDDSEEYDYKNNVQGIRLWNTLSSIDEENLLVEISALFPTIFSANKNYNDISTYLATKKGIVNPSLRDKFSAGGKYHYEGEELPKYFKRLLDDGFICKLAEYLGNPNINEVRDYWGNIDVGSYKDIWLSKVIEYINSHEQSQLSDSAKQVLISYIEQNIR
ncbi:hypothetical protein AB4140_09455 [Shewanella sp. 10N.286.51.B2]|uniref:hypothetical protein n=1 Tax=Shewanella sp. 10N.286.51.B2 TaxID=3229707 RepID=UPI00354D1567